MQNQSTDPNKCYTLEIENEIFGKKETLTIPNLTLEIAKEYFDRMEADAVFTFYRTWPDGSINEVDFENAKF